jgi:translation elongation factor IF5A
MQCSALRKNGHVSLCPEFLPILWNSGMPLGVCDAKLIQSSCRHVVIKGRPCKIVEMSTSKTGKHGHAKVHLVAIDIFTNKKLEDLCPSTHNMDVPNVSRTEYQFSHIDDDFLNLIKPDGSEKNDVKVPEGELGDRIREYEESGTDICEFPSMAA